MSQFGRHHQEITLPQHQQQQQQQQQSIHQAYRNATANVIENHIRHKLPTLVLKLQQNIANSQSNRQSRFGYSRKTNKSDKELDHLLESNFAEFKRELNDNIDSFHQQVLSSKPNPSEQQSDPYGYAARMHAYQEFLQLANEIVKHMQQSFTAILNNYREYIERLWKAIEHGSDLRPIQQQFEEQLRLNMDRQWSLIFREADDLIRDIEINLRDTRRHANTCSLHQQRYPQ